MKQNVHVKFHSEALLEELEARQLFSGGIEGILVENNEPEAAVYMDISTESGALENSDSIVTTTADSIRQELVFIDTDVENYQELLNDILNQSDEERNIEVILLDNQRDGIEQITETLANFQNLDAVHLISHGSEGSVDIGNSQLDYNALTQNLSDISSWGDSFTQEGDFLIYGCNLAATEDGESLVQALSSLTHTDVAASDDLTGQAELGGDWELEYNAGIIESDIAISSEAQQHWAGVLAETIYESNTANTNDFEIKNTDPAGQTFTHTSGNGTYDVNRISIQLYEDSSPNQTITVSLMDAWNGTVLGTATISSNSLTGSFAEYDFGFADVTLDDGTSYVIKITTNGSGGVFFAIDDNGSYAGGNQLDKDGNVDSGKDITFHVSQVTSANSTGLIAHYSFDIDAHDSSGNLNNGTTQGNAFIDTTNATDKVGEGKLSLDGSDDYVNLSSSISSFSGLTNGTISAWVNVANGDISENTIFDIGDGAPNANYVSLFVSNGYLILSSEDNNVEVLRVSSTATINDGNWHHVAFSSSDSGNALYIDGVQLTGGAISYATGSNTSSNFINDLDTITNATIGAFNLGTIEGEFNGQIDDVRIYSSAVSNDTITALASENISNTYIVSTTADSGVGSLRQAILDANANNGVLDTIRFDIGADGSIQTINLLTALDPITDTVIIDGFSQYGALTPTTPLIELNGSATTGADGIRLNAGSSGSTIQGIIINNFDDDGIDIASDNNIIVGNWIGLDNTGNAAASNGSNGVEVDSAGNTIGGTTDLERNVISGNNVGIRLQNSTAINNVVQGNYIGTDASGTASISNSSGVLIASSSNNTIGGTAIGTANVISGNSGSGILLRNSDTTDNVIQGNIIGLDASGTSSLGNSDGVHLMLGASDNIIGGSTSAERNIISANSDDGIHIDDAGTDGNIIQGNYIGTDINGTVDLGNIRNGIRLTDNASNTTIGGSGAGKGNLISGNEDAGVLLGTPTTAVSNVTIQGNLIGTDVTGTFDLGNTEAGIRVEFGTNTNISIGGTETNAGNTIAYNGFSGVIVESPVTGVALLGNSIFSNTLQGIDLGDDGTVASNDAGDGDTGANNLQNFPVLSTAVSTGTQITIDGSFNSAANSYYRIEFFASSSADASGNGEGETYLGYADITSDGSGNAMISSTLTAVVADGAIISATATKSDASFSTFTDTSEFAANIIASTVNAAPIANNDITSTDEDTPLIIDPTTNDTDAESDTISVVEFTQAANGTVIDNGDGTLTYTPNSEYSGADSFEYVAIDTGSGLQNYWGLGGDAVDAIGGSDGTLNGTTTVAGDLGDALSFNETSDYVLLPDVTYASEFSISFDFKIDDNTGSLFQYIYSHGDINATDSINVFFNEATHGTDPNVLRTVVRDANDTLDNTALEIDISSLIGDSQWHNYTLTVGANGLEVYIDGVSAATDATRGTDGINPTTGVYLGARQDLDADRRYGGELDSVQIYDNALNSTQVADISSDNNKATVNITVDAVNDAPVNTVPGVQVTNEDTAIIFNTTNSNLISISDDVGETLTATVSVTNGSLTLSQVTGLTFDAGSNASSTMTVTGTVENINAALDGLQYAPTLDYNGGDTLTIETSDATLLTLNLDANLLGYYEFNSAAAGDDSSPLTSNDGTLMGDASVVNDATRSDVLSLDGAGDYVEITGRATTSQQATLSAWINVDAGASNGEVISVTNSFTLRVYTGGVQGFFYDGSSFNLTNSAVDIRGTGWHHIAYTIDNTNDEQVLYIDGVAVITTTYTTAVDYMAIGTGDTYIGSNQGASNFFKGSIDNARIYDRALTATEIADLQFAPVEVTDTDTVAIMVDLINDAPTATNLSASESYTEDSALNLTDIVVSDVDSTDATVTLTLSDTGAGSLNTATSSAVTSTFVGGVWTATGAIADINTLLAGVTFTPILNYNSDFTIATSVDDGIAAAVTGTKVMTAIAVNDAPVLDLDANDSVAAGIDYSNTWTQGGGSVLITDSDAVLTDVDTANLTSLTIILTNHWDGSDEVLSANTSGTSIIASYNSTTGVLTLSGADTVANYQQVLSTISYDNSHWAPYSETRVIEFVASDGTDTSLTATTNLTMATDFGVLVVTNTSDSIGGNTSSIDALIASDGGDGISLREAIIASNNSTNGTGPDVIRFDIAGPGPHIIQPLIDLPIITEAIIIDGTSEPDYSGVPNIILDGSLGTAANGLNITGDDSQILGVAIYGFNSDGVYITGSNNLIQNSYIGIEADGVTANGNGDDGINIVGVSASGNQIIDNLISGNTNRAIYLLNGASGNTIQGNLIGTDASGAATSASLANGDAMIVLFDAHNNQIGGVNAGEENVLADVGMTEGISIRANSSGNIIEGNYIGTDVTGTIAMGTYNGIGISSTATGNIIGGTAAGAGNTIAFNDGRGISILSSGSNTILGNNIYSNASLGIDLNNDGVTTNDSGDADTGANNLQNYPLLTSVLSDGSSAVVIDGSINTTANATYRIEFFASAIADGSGNGEAERYLGFTTVTTDGSGNTSFSANLSTLVANGEFVTATATVDLGGGNYGGTSEFALNHVAVVDLTPQLDLDSNDSTTVGIDYANTWTQGGGSVLIADSDAVLTDIDNINLTSLTITLTNHWDGTGEVLSADTTGTSITASFDSATGVLTLSNVDTVANYQQVLRTISYDNSYWAPYSETRVIEFVASDGTDTSLTATTNLTMATDFGVLVVTNTSNSIGGDTSSIDALIANDGGDGISLQEAIIASNNSANGTGPDVIRFDINGTGPHIIQPTSTLPAFTEAVIIDGTTEPDYAGTPIIVLDGSLAGAGANGIVLAAGSDGSTIRGLVINNFTADGIDISSDNNVIQGNYIGTDVTGTSASANNQGIIFKAGASGNTIGGTTAATRNIISGNIDDGIQIIGLGASNNTITGNYIGTDVTGALNIGNGGDGIIINDGATDNIIGGTAAGEGNLISGNNGDGIQIGSTTTTNPTSNITIQGNFIGTDVTGLLNLANAGAGVDLEDGVNILVGGVAANAGNTIAFNNNDGIEVSAPVTDSAFLGNLIFSNTSLGIDLNNDTVSANDSGDGDTGANNLQNYPLLTSVLSDGSSAVIIDGSINTTANTSYRIEFFASAIADGSGNGEAERYLGFTTVTTDGSGNTIFNANLSTLVANGEFVTATATVDLGGGNYGGTSEFAQNHVAVVDLTPLLDLDSNDSSGTGGTDFDTAWIEDAGAVAIADIDAVLIDIDSTNLSSLTVTITNQLDGTAELLSANTTGTSITASYDSGTGVLTLSGSDTVAMYQQVLRTITYDNSSDTPDTTTRSITFVASDGTNSSTVATAAVSVTATNDTPTIESTINTQNLTEDFASYSIDLNAAFADVETSDVNLTYGVSGNTNINVSIVNGIATITHTADWNGSENLTFTATDTGSLSVNQIVAFNVSAINDTAVIAGTDTGSVQEDVAVVTNSISTSGTLTITDVDTGEASFVAETINGTLGDLTIDSAGNWSYVADNTQATIQQLDLGESTTDTLTVTSFDGTTHNVVITINGSDDLAVIGGTTTGSVTEDGTLTSTGALTISETDTSDPTNFVDVAITASDNGYGTFEMTGNNWTFTLDNDNAAVQALDITETLTDTFTFTAPDGVTQQVTVTINGAEDNPIFDSVAITAATEDSAYSYTINTSDVDIEAVSITATTLPAWLSLTDNGDGTATLTGTPINAEVGDHSVVLNVDDGSVNSNQSFTITVTNTNDAAIIAGTDTGAVQEDVAVVTNNISTTGTLTITDVDTGEASFQIATVVGTYGSLDIAANGDWTYTADNTQAVIQSLDLTESLTDTLTITAFDGTTHNVVITINGTNDISVIGGTTTGSVQEDGTLTSTGALAITDTDTSDPTNFVDVTTTASDNGYGTFAMSGNSWIFTMDNANAAVQALDVGETLTDTYTFTAPDGVTQQVTVTINGAEDIPLFDSTAITAATEDSAYSYTITTSDVDIEAVTITATTLPAWLTLTDNGDGTATLTGTPLNANVGNNNVVLNVSDGSVSSNQSFTVAVANTNDAAIIAGTDTGSVQEDVAVVSNNISTTGTLTITDVDTGENSFVAETITGTLGDLTIDASGNWSYVADNTQATIQQLDLGESTTDTLTVTSFDGTTHNVVITINGSDDASVIGGTTTGSVQEDSTLTSTGGLTITDTDTSDPTNFVDMATTASDNGYGTFEMTGNSWTYSLNNSHATVQALDVGETLSDTYTFTAPDGVTQQVTVTINGAEDIPLFDSAAITAATEDSAYSYTITTSDVDIEAVTITSTTLPAWLTLTDNGDGTATLTGTPLNANVDNNNVELNVSDGSVSSNQRFTIAVANTNDAAVIAGTDTGAVQEDVSVVTNNISITGTLTITDVDTGEASFQAATIAGTYGSLTLDTAGNWTYTADNTQAAIQALDAGESLTDTITVSAFDGTTHNVVLTINGTEDTSVIGGTTTGSVTEDGTLTSTGALTITDTDTFDPTNFVNVTPQASDNGYGTFEITGNSWTFTLNNAHAAVQALDVGETLSDTYTFTAPDGVTQQVTVTINGAEDIPVFDSTAITAAIEDAAYSYTITTSDVDIEAVTITATTLPAWLMLTDNGDGTATLTGMPLNGNVGNNSVVLNVSDGSVSSNQSFTIAVANTNDAAIIAGTDTGAVQEDVSVVTNNISTTGTLTITDVDTGEASFVAETITGTLGDLTIDAAGNWSYTADNTQATIQQLDLGESTTDTLMVTSFDGTTHNVVITINGSDDTAVITGTTTGSVTEDGTLTSTGALTIIDTDTSDPTDFVDVATTASDNGYGTFELTGNNWTYSLNNSHAAVQALDVGETLPDTYTFTAPDGVTQQVTVTINGAEDIPVFDSTAVTAATEDAAYSYTITTSDVDIETLTITASTLPTWLTLTDNGDGTATLTGTPLNANVGNNNVVLNVSDGSVSSNQSFTIAVANTNDAATVSSANIALSETDAALTTSGTLTSIDIDNPDNTFTVQTIVGTIGTLNIDAAGVWDFTANSAFDNLSVGQNVNKTFSVTSVDGTTSSVKITINGTNDTPVVSGISAGSVQEDVTVVSTNINTTGLLTITDVDTGEASFQAGSIAGAYGNLTIDATGSWIYTADNNQTAIQQLDQGESLTDTLTVSTYDGTPHNIVITLNGTEDAATISGTTTGTVTEDSLLTSSGPLTITDTDTSDPTDFVDLAATASDNGYGSFEIRANTWTYTLDNTNTSVQALDATETLSDSYTFTAPDGVTQQVTVTINGAEDTPVVAATQLFSVSELATNGFSLGNAIGTDIDTRSTLQDWSISNGNEDSIFAINAATGEITVSDNSKLDFESTVSYTLSLTVTDGNNTSAVENVTVNVTNAATVITTGQAYTISETAANNAIVGRVGTTGDSPVTYRIKAGNTGSVFAIDNTGQITVADALALDYETLTQYTLTIEVSDGTTTNKQEVIVRVTDVNDTIVENLTDDPGFTTPDPADEINTDYQSTENAPSENNTTTPNDFEITDEYVANTRSTADPTSLLSESGSEINSETNDANIDATQKEHSDDSNYVKPGSGFDQWIESQLHTLNEIDLQLDETHDLFEVSEFDGNEELWKNIDLMRDQMDADKKLLDRQDVEIEFVAGATISFTAGFVSWVLRGGALLSSLLSSVSIFKQFDPMAVVFKKSNKNDKNQVNDDEQDEVEAMFDNENKK